jgi:hypothetical protein
MCSLSVLVVSVLIIMLSCVAFFVLFVFVVWFVCQRLPVFFWFTLWFSLTFTYRHTNMYFTCNDNRVEICIVINFKSQFAYVQDYNCQFISSISVVYVILWNFNLKIFLCQIYTIGLNTSFTTYMKLSPVPYKHRSDREHDG